MVSSLDRAGIEKAMGEAWIARFLKFSKRSAFVLAVCSWARSPAERLWNADIMTGALDTGTSGSGVRPGRVL
jgi:hypothetical protein